MPGMTRQRRRGGSSPADVDIAPLVDVVFLLLVFFMSIWQAAHIEVKAELSLPDTLQGDPEIQRDRDRLIVNVDKFGDYYVAGTRLDKQQLRLLLTREALRSRDDEGFAERPVFIRADAGLAFGTVQDVMSMCRDVRIWKLSLRTRQEKGETP